MTRYIFIVCFLLLPFAKAEISAQKFASLCLKELMSQPVGKVGLIKDTFKAGANKNMIYKTMDNSIVDNKRSFHDLLTKAKIIKAKNYYIGEQGYYLVIFGKDNLPKYALHQNPKYGDDTFVLYFCHPSEKGVRIGGRFHVSESEIDVRSLRSESILVIHFPQWKKTEMYSSLFVKGL